MRAAMTPDHDVLQHGHLREEADVLEGAAHAEHGTPMGRHTLESVAVEDDGAFIVALDPGHAVEERCLPGPVWSDDRMDRPRFDAHIHPVDREQTAEPFGHLRCLEERHASPHPSPPAGRRRAPGSRGARPRALPPGSSLYPYRSFSAAALPSPTGTNLPFWIWISVPFLIASPACLPSTKSTMVILPSALVRPGKSLMLASVSRTLFRSASRLLGVLVTPACLMAWASIFMAS